MLIQNENLHICDISALKVNNIIYPLSVMFAEERHTEAAGPLINITNIGTVRTIVRISERQTPLTNTWSPLFVLPLRS